MKRSKSGSKGSKRRGGFQPGYVPPAFEEVGRRVGKVVKRVAPAVRAAMNSPMGQMMISRGKKLMGRGSKFKKGSAEAKAHMAKLRSMRRK
jgi:hypothetical protein